MNGEPCEGTVSTAPHQLVCGGNSSLRPSERAIMNSSAFCAFRRSRPAPRFGYVLGLRELLGDMRDLLGVLLYRQNIDAVYAKLFEPMFM